MSKYGETAVAAARLAGCGLSPRQAWNVAGARLFTAGTAAQKKACPRSAFLGLAGCGWVRDVEPGHYTSSAKNAGYAKRAAVWLTAHPDEDVSPADLWRRVAGTAISHNAQMDVVLALWKAGLLTLAEGKAQR